ncbi:small secreted hydrophilic protein [Streptomyces hainanensis]|uniref:Small secreted hydrophilic protein n=1 Tax=Streptomyces hainanensis TaxID=402648 RepID=A0A4R4SVI4_9ACTN|nr:small secreted hydrophilic protein [Streptomyces hainanensis]TDC68137.1 small secreted hydrophilic protein [Streptomyces hainanensis]
MTFSRRVATLTAVVLIPIGIAGTSFLLGDDLETPSVPAEVDLQPTPGGGADDRPGEDTEPTAPDASPSDPRQDVVPQPSPTEGSVDDQSGDDDLDDDADDTDDPAVDDDARDGADDG